MREKTQKPTEPEPSRRGRKKEKTQVSVRIDQKLMAQAYQHIERTGTRITDLMERGLILAMQEENFLPADSGRARFLVARTGADQQRLYVHLAALLMLPEVKAMSPSEVLLREVVLRGLSLVESDERGYRKAIEAYGS